MFVQALSGHYTTSVSNLHVAVLPCFVFWYEAFHRAWQCHGASICERKSALRWILHAGKNPRCGRSQIVKHLVALTQSNFRPRKA